MRVERPSNSRPRFLRQHLQETLGEAVRTVLGATVQVPLERPAATAHGDYATSIALQHAGAAGVQPRELAEKLVVALDCDSDYVERVEVAGSGFINFFASRTYLMTVVRQLLNQGTGEFWPRPGQGRKAQVEFCSANPTGPLGVAHGRGLVLGDTVASILAAAGYEVTREYYYNDTGRQMRLLGESVRARCRELLGLEAEFPADGYRGEYITEIAKESLEAAGADLPGLAECAEFAEEQIFGWIKDTMARLGVRFDLFYNEATLHETGKVDEILRLLAAKGLTYEKDGALWLIGPLLGLGGDRVLVKATGESTYRLPDLAYHVDKLRRGFDLVVDVLGTDHLEESEDVLAGLRALEEDADKIRVIIHQFVTLMRGGRQVRMSTRKGVFVTLDELVDEVGSDVARYFFLMRTAGSHLPFDVDLARKESEENPVFYLQYAHARISGVLGHAGEMGVDLHLEDSSLVVLETPEEWDVLRAVSRYPDVTDDLVRNLEPHRLVTYLTELAAAFHLFYHRHRILGEDRKLSSARLALTLAVRELLREGLALLGVRAPERM
jgi:arginyl-tRNA synthetase